MVLLSPIGFQLLLAGAAILGAGFVALLWREWRRRRQAERKSAEAQSQLQTITASMREGVIAFDMDRQLQFVNPAFERLTGYPEEELREQEFLQYIHPDDRPAILAEWDRLAQGGALRDQEYRVVTRAGQIRWCSSSWEPMRDESGRQIGFLGTEFDITERKLAEEEMRRDTELLEAVLEVEQAVMAAGLDSQTVMRVIAERSQVLTGATGGVIESIEGNELVPLMQVGTTHAPRLPFSTSLSGLCVRSGELQRSDDTFSDPRIGHQEYRQLKIRSLLVVPLKDDSRILGVLKVVSPQVGAFSDRDARALRLLGGLMGAALSHAAAFEGRQSRLEERTRALQDSEQRFKQLVDVAQEGIWVTDDRGIITYVNQRMADLLGYPSGSVLGRPVYDFIETGSRPGAQHSWTRRGHRPAQSQDLRFRRQDGSQVWGLVSSSPMLDRNGVLVGTVGMVTDITERKRTEEQLRRSADRLAMLHDMDQAIVAAQSPAEVGRAALARIRRMVNCQRCTVVLFDVRRREAHLIAGFARGVHLAPAALAPNDVFQETLRADSVRYIEDLAALESPSPPHRELLAEGIRTLLSVPLLVEGEAIGEISLGASTPAAFDAEHREIALEVAAPIAIAIQHARLREELARQAAELERRVAERSAEIRGVTAELETVLYSVSHDLRAPLRQLLGFSRLLLEESVRESDVMPLQYARRIQEAADRMTTLVDDLINVSRIGRQDMVRRPVALGPLVEDIIGQLRSTTPTRAIDWQVEELPTVDADPGLLKLALTHLLANAVKFTRQRDRATIRVRPLESDGQNGIAIEDNGVGFKMAYAGKLFGLFQRLHRVDEFEGNGAGLAMVQRIAHKHGGRVWAEAEPDKGATFFLTLGTPIPQRRTSEDVSRASGHGEQADLRTDARAS